LHRLQIPKLDRRWIRAIGIRVMRIRIRAMGIRAMRIRLRATWLRGRLRRARTATTPITPTHAPPTATTDLAGSWAESLLVSGRGAGVGAASMGDVALADGATTEAGRPFPGTEDFAVGSVTVTPAEVDVPSVAVDMPTVEADVASVEADTPTAEADTPTAEADIASVEADMATVEADVASVEADMPTVEADMATVEAEAEAVPMVVGAGRFRHNSKLSRPTAFAVGRLVGRYRLRLRERI